MNSKTIAVTIEKPAEDVYRFAREPRNLTKWLTFISGVREADGEWIMETEAGPMAIRFVPENEFGVIDHIVRLADGQEVLNPMRVVPNGAGSEVMFTLFQTPGMTDERFAEDATIVERDLRTLKEVLEQE